jgi:hypothetical protein
MIIGNAQSTTTVPDVAAVAKDVAVPAHHAFVAIIVVIELLHSCSSASCKIKNSTPEVGSPASGCSVEGLKGFINIS